MHSPFTIVFDVVITKYTANIHNTYFPVLTSLYAYISTTPLLRYYPEGNFTLKNSVSFLPLLKYIHLFPLYVCVTWYRAKKICCFYSVSFLAFSTLTQSCAYKFVCFVSSYLATDVYYEICFASSHSSLYILIQL